MDLNCDGPTSCSLAFNYPTNNTESVVASDTDIHMPINMTACTENAKYSIRVVNSTQNDDALSKYLLRNNLLVRVL